MIRVAVLWIIGIGSFLKFCLPVVNTGFPFTQGMIYLSGMASRFVFYSGNFFVTYFPGSLYFFRCSIQKFMLICFFCFDLFAAFLYRVIKRLL